MVGTLTCAHNLEGMKPNYVLWGRRPSQVPGGERCRLPVWGERAGPGVVTADRLPPTRVGPAQHGALFETLLGPDCEVLPPADALHTHSSLFLEGSSQGSPPMVDAPASPPQAPRSQRPGRRMSQGSSHSGSSESSDSLAPVGASCSE